MFDKETDILGGERGPVVLESDMRIRAFHVCLDEDADFAIDIHVLGVLDQLPDPALWGRGRRLRSGTELGHHL